MNGVARSLGNPIAIGFVPRIPTAPPGAAIWFPGIGAVSTINAAPRPAATSAYSPSLPM